MNGSCDGAIGLEPLDQLPDDFYVAVPISGGGLISGIAIAVKVCRPGCQTARSVGFIGGAEREPNRMFIQKSGNQNSKTYTHSPHQHHSSRFIG